MNFLIIITDVNQALIIWLYVDARKPHEDCLLLKEPFICYKERNMNLRWYQCCPSSSRQNVWKYLITWTLRTRVKGGDSWTK